MFSLYWCHTAKAGNDHAIDLWSLHLFSVGDTADRANDNSVERGPYILGGVMLVPYRSRQT